MHPKGLTQCWPCQQASKEFPQRWSASEALCYKVVVGGTAYIFFSFLIVTCNAGGGMSSAASIPNE